MGNNKYLITSASRFNELNDAANAEFGYPNATTLSYAAPIEHNDGTQVLFVVEPRAIPLLTAEEQSAALSQFPVGWVGKVEESSVDVPLDRESPAENVIVALRDSEVSEIKIEVTDAFDAGCSIAVGGASYPVDVVGVLSVPALGYVAGENNIVATFNGVPRTQGALVITVSGRLIYSS